MTGKHLVTGKRFVTGKPVSQCFPVTILARERIHRDILIHDSQLFRLHAVELQTAIRTTIGFMGLAPPRGLATLCTDIVARV